MRIKTDVVLLLLCLSVPCFGQVKVPDTPAGQKFSAWLEAFNRGDHAAYQQFLEQNYPSRKQDADQAMAFREMTGGFHLKNVEPSSPDTQLALLQERNSDQFARLTLEVESAEPHKIVSIGLMAIPRPPEFPLPHLRESELAATVRTKLEQDAAAGRFAGTVMIARNGKPVRAEAYGPSDREHRTPTTLQTRFRIGSMNKMFTATATLQLVQAGKLGLLTTGKVDTPGGGRYAFGFDDHTANGIRCFGHGGGAPGMNGELEICPTAGYVVAVLANLDPPAAGRISQFITNRLPEK